MLVSCDYCSNTFDRPLKAVNQSKKRGYKQYCNSRCATEDRKKPRGKEYLEYQKQYRIDNSERLKHVHRKKYAKKKYGGLAPVFILAMELKDESNA